MHYRKFWALAVLLIATPSHVQAQLALTGCFPDFSGLACLVTPPSATMTDADYGTVYVQIQPPSSITEQAVKASGKKWRNWVRRFFLPQTKSGALVAEVYQGPNKIAIIPVSMFSIDEKKGLKIETGNSLVALQQATPYFALDSVSNPMRVVLTFKSSKEQSSNILGLFTSAIGAAAGLGASGYIFTNGTNPVSAALQPIEGAITSSFNTKGDSKLELGFNFESNSGADFSFGFDPSGQDRSGRITFQLVRRGSVFGNFPIVKQRPQFPFMGRADAGAANEVLLRQRDGKTLLALLQSSTATQFDKMQQTDVKPADFEAACTVVENAVKSQGINSHDVAATMWATMIGAGGVQREDLRKTPCMKRWAGTFAVYGLILPPAEPVLHPVETVVKPPVADISSSGLRTFMDSLFQVMAQPQSNEVRIRAYLSMLSAYPHPSIDLESDFGLASLDQSANARFVAEKMATLSFRSGCFVRLDGNSVNFLARLLSAPATAEQPLWLMNVRLESLTEPATANSTTIRAWSIRNAQTEDLAGFSTAFPTRPGCSDPSTAPA